MKKKKTLKVKGWAIIAKDETIFVVGGLFADNKNQQPLAVYKQTAIAWDEKILKHHKAKVVPCKITYENV